MEEAKGGQQGNDTHDQQRKTPDVRAVPFAGCVHEGKEAGENQAVKVNKKKKKKKAKGNAKKKLNKNAKAFVPRFN